MTQLYPFPTPSLQPAAPTVLPASSAAVAPALERALLEYDPLFAGALMTVDEVATRLAISSKTVHLLIRCGRLRAYYFCSRPRIARDDLRAFMHRSRT